MIDEQVNAITLCEPLDEVVSVFVDTANQIVGNPDI
jgi:hypothetical protein